MAVVTRFARAQPDPTLYKAPRPIYRQANVNVMTSDAAIASGDSATSKVYFGRVPSRCIVLPQSILAHSAIAGVTSLHLGIDQGPNGTPSPAVLASALSVAAAGTKNAAAAVATGDLYKMLWQLAGFGHDPAREFDIIATLNADASAAGTLHLSLLFALLGP